MKSVSDLQDGAAAASSVSEKKRASKIATSVGSSSSSKPKKVKVKSENKNKMTPAKNAKKGKPVYELTVMSHFCISDKLFSNVVNKNEMQLYRGYQR